MSDLGSALTTIGAFLLLISFSAIAARLHTLGTKTRQVPSKIRESVAQRRRSADALVQPDTVPATATMPVPVVSATGTSRPPEGHDWILKHVRDEVDAVLDETERRIKEALEPRPFDRWTSWFTGLGLLAVFGGSLLSWIGQ